MKINPYILNGINANKNNTNELKNKIDNNSKTGEITENRNIDKVSRIKEAIKKGTYKIDIEETAKQMAKDLLK